MDQVMSWGQALMSAFSNTVSLFAAAIPKILAFIVILVIGWMIAAGLAKVIAMLLRKLKFNEIAETSGVAKFIQNAGLSIDASGFLAQVVKWFIRLIALVAAFNALGLPAVSSILNSLLLWLPNLFVALVILTIGGWAASAIEIFVRGVSTTAQSNDPDLLVKIAKTAVWVFTAIVAFNQLGIASSLIQILFTAVTGGLALGFAIAVGLGSKDKVAELLNKWCSKSDKP